MSDAPCTGCRSTNKGRLWYAYVHHYVGQEREERRVRLCKDCIVEVLVPLLESADWKEGDEWLPIDYQPPATPSNGVQSNTSPDAPRAENLFRGVASTLTTSTRAVGKTTSSAVSVKR